jgi:hypothetical protein
MVNFRALIVKIFQNIWVGKNILGKFSLLHL